jgi:hypothetical protein
MEKDSLDVLEELDTHSGIYYSKHVGEMTKFNYVLFFSKNANTSKKFAKCPYQLSNVWRI